MLDNTISGYRHKVAFFKTPGDLWMLKGTSPNVCLTIAPNYRLQNERIPTIESSGNVITRRFAGPLLRRYCDRTKTPGAAKTTTTRRLICEGRAIGHCSTPNDRTADDDDVIRKADDITSNVDDVRKAAAAIRLYDDDIRGGDNDIHRQCFSTGYQRVGCGPESWPNTRPRWLPWHVGRVYSGDSLMEVADQSGLGPVRERTQSSLTVSLSRNKQSGRIVQQPKFHVHNNLPVLYGNINSRAFATGEKKHFSHGAHEPKLINRFMEEEKSGSNSELRRRSRPVSLQNSLVVCKLHPLKTRSGPTVGKSSDLVIRREANNTPENGVCTLKADLQECRATGEAEQTHERCRRVTEQSASEPDNATFLQKDHGMGKTYMIFGSEDHVHQAKDR